MKLGGPAFGIVCMKQVRLRIRATESLPARENPERGDGGRIDLRTDGWPIFKRGMQERGSWIAGIL